MFFKKEKKSNRKVLSQLRYLATITLGTMFASVAIAGTQAVCPAGPAGDKSFRTTNLSKCVWVLNDHHNNTPRINKTIGYHIYCPGRAAKPSMSAYIGSRIVAGTQIRDSGGRRMNPVTYQHNRVHLKPVYAGTPHRFEYWCNHAGKRKVATHIRLDVRATRKGPTRRIYTYAGSQNGGIALNKRMDREYKVRPHYPSSVKGKRSLLVDARSVFLRQERHLVRRARTLRTSGRPTPGKICILPTTNIQCAPCRWSNKFIIRVKTVRRNGACPSGSVQVY